jgi:hypothetical protein
MTAAILFALGVAALIAIIGWLSAPRPPWNR